MTPNQITAVRLVSGIAAAAAFAVGEAAWSVVGSLVFLLGMLLDRADGELARQTGQSSKAGYWFDIVSDAGSNVLAMAGIGFGLRGEWGLVGPLLGLLAGAGIGALFWQIFALRLVQPRGWRPARGVLVDPDDALVLVPVLVCAGAALPMLVAAAVVTPLAVLWVGVRRPARRVDFARARRIPAGSGEPR